MIFEFIFTPLNDIQPWGKPDNQNLSWFGFTEGEYRIKVGSEYLLDYSTEFVNHLHNNFPEHFYRTKFVDYYIVRLWEDILEMIPAIIEPVPKEIRHFINSDYESFRALTNKADSWQESGLDKEIDEDYFWQITEAATNWLDNRLLNSGYLSPPARIWIWSDENVVIFSWDNREIEVENIPVWSATQGHYRIKREDFIDELREFDKNFLSQMNERVETVCRTWNKPEIEIDFDLLKSEQKHRATWLESNIKNAYKTDWSEVLSAIKTIMRKDLTTD